MGARRWIMPVAVEVTLHDGRTYVVQDRCTFTTARGKGRALKKLEKRTMRQNPDWARLAWTYGVAYSPVRSAR